MTEMSEYQNETIPVREAHRLDEEKLRAYLSAHMDGIGDDIALHQFAVGQSNPTYMVTTGGREYVLRKKPPGTLLPSAHAVDREYRIITALGPTEVPVPKTYLLCEDDDVLGTAFYVMDKVDGRVLDDQFAPAFSAAERSAVYDHMLEVLATFHAVDYEAVGLGDFGRPGNYYIRQINRWTKQYVASQTDEIPAMDHLMKWLPENVPQDDTTTLVHGDYRLGNAIVHPTQPRISAVLDWELATLGHPLADLAYCYVACFMGTGEPLELLPGLPSEDEFIHGYCALTDRGGIPDWTFYKVFQLFRLAAIVQGVYKRGLDGISSSAKAVTYGDKCRDRAVAAWAMVAG
ncbi:MAG: phosphotransferase family protein [Rhodospirillaceae bacterium]|jgi:aminoglycoside phosphotransferase (APT) family kinase protein|nr:phosphotransferase family protein [Rhodospirillaceae bacterium]MBT4486082.1 phosphotransferase family protein [Rhodospirillaceae bacterium]MBT5193822.1 phosphotransferase family protein [Rhodospirillaceae bacterium]MBT7759323.1 phosphotransferase family protein [Rhodospirillaceae bacterium]